MSDSTDSELEIVNPSPVRAHTKYSVAQKTKEKRKRDHSSSIDAETRAKQPQNADFYAEKGKLFCKFCSIRMDHSRQSVLSAHCIGDTHKKQKERTAQTGQIQGSLFTTLPVPNEARLDNLILISDWVRACAGSKLSLNAASSPLMRKFLSKHIPSGGSIPQRDGLSLYLNGMFSRLFHTSPGCCRIWHGQCWLHVSFLQKFVETKLTKLRAFILHVPYNQPCD